MSYIKMSMDEHGICEAYIESQETALNTAKGHIQELLSVADYNHSACDWQSDTECRAERYGEGTAEQHRVFRDALVAIATTRKWELEERGE